jgi:hypothetical protein
MSLIVTCTACQFGRHEDHREVVQAVPEGMIGGSRCDCKGECRDRFANDLGAAQDYLRRGDLDGLAALASRGAKARAEAAVARLREDDTDA